MLLKRVTDNEEKDYTLMDKQTKEELGKYDDYYGACKAFDKKDYINLDKGGKVKMEEERRGFDIKRVVKRVVLLRDLTEGTDKPWLIVEKLTGKVLNQYKDSNEAEEEFEYLALAEDMNNK